MPSSGQEMVSFLTVSWLAAVNDRLQNDSTMAKLSEGISFVGEINIRQPPERRLHVYTFVVDSKLPRVVAGPHPYPDVTIRYSYQTAGRIACGEISQPHARRAGLMTVVGDFAKLTASESVSSRFAFLLTQVPTLESSTGRWDSLSGDTT